MTAIAHDDTGSPPPDALSDRDRAMMGITLDQERRENDVVSDDEPEGTPPDVREEPSGDSLNALLQETGWDHLPRVRELYDRHDYRAPEQESARTPEQLELAWDAASTERIAERAGEVMGAYEYRRREGDRAPIVGLDVPVNEQMTMRVTARASIDDQPVIEMELTRPQSEPSEGGEPGSETIAKFFSTQTDEGTWELSHRFVDPAFRAQGIGGEMLRRMEDAIRAKARRSGAEQRLAIPARQVDVVLFGLKNGYRPRNETDRERLRVLLTDRSERLLVTTAEGYRSDGGELPGFMYDRERIRELQQEYWDAYMNDTRRTPPEGSPDRIPLSKLFDDDAARFIANGYTINLERRFSPAA
ncbi:MAG: hypothetical protein HY341_00035 [Candidatus Kerfeldbacteria bacterium]|nr:hypothetical protein [Candidatus Kerfeldbacteria bacterium]